MAFRTLFLLVFVWIYVNVCFLNTSSRLVYNMPLALILGAAFFLLSLLAVYRLRLFAERRLRFKRFLLRHSTLVFFFCIFLLFALQCRLVYALYRPVGWDVSALVKGAQDLSTLGKDPYFSEFPNNLLLVAILHGLLRLASLLGITNTWLFLDVFNTILVDFSIALVFLICRRLWGIAAGFMSFAFFVAVFGFSPWLTVPYSDTFTIFFGPLALYLFLRARDSKRISVKLALCFLIGFFSMAGYYIKPFTLVVPIAILLYLLISGFKSLKRAGAFLLAAALIAAGSGAAVYLDKTQVQTRLGKNLNASEVVPFTHFLMMGLNIQISGSTHRALYGAYNDKDYAVTLSQPTLQAKEAIDLAVTQQRLAKLGIFGYASFLSNKANWIFSDGLFWLEGEGTDVDISSVSQDPVSTALQSFFRFYGWNFPAFSQTEQGVWTLLLFYLVCPLFMKRDDFKSAALTVVRFAVFGILVYLLLSEARSRYLISQIPLFVILGTFGFCIFKGNLFRSFPFSKNKAPVARANRLPE